ncbi:putative redox protein, regulator of disulfide bond formation [Bernardetia litoralis DSM 6794]|uniref:Putative redox protein, regulator of disulfide bond formation n=1 Tax=Bernardetia litoralis (strain ATCC 23117 / DSM 6794 / NBRC 15988 / NCIMB 1366 / Fx l1 / Sio-4) TaxID=880071 RepID=I4AP75_BERLS|nr:OsmC family protein [Bernardetia litoralis]AFM05760.1 putative redox protein, regulator of disulfide bond formation [Bernardetia litoralis DSM 6794]
MSILSFSFQGINKNSAKFTGKSRDFELTIDEPIDLGGTDEHPNPVEYILAGYAGCLNVVAHIVAKELNIELKKLEINVSGKLNPAKLLGQNTTERAGFQHIEVSLKPQTTATDIELLGWLQEIEKRCPVGDNLQNQTPVFLQIEKELFVPSLN